MTAIAAAGFDGFEIFENDLLYFDGTPADVKRIAGDLGLRILLFQPFRDFEAGPRERLQRNLDRAERKFDVMEQLDVDLMLVCSSVAPDAVDDDALAAGDLHELGQRAARRGLRIGYEALCWGRNVSTYGHAWKIVQAADHPAVGLVVDSFHTLAIRDDDSGIAEIPGDRIFMLQIADAPLIQLDPLSWSRHFRLFPGQGAFPLTRFVRNVVASGYGGPISLEIFNDEFRAAPPRPTAIDAMRSLILLEEQLIAESGVKPASPVVAGMLAPPAAPVCRGFEFVEFAVDADTRPRLAAMFDAMGFAQTGVHRSKDVSLHSQGDVHLILNAEKDSFAHSYFLVHGPSVCALAFRVDDAQRATERALRYKAQTFRGRVGPNELVIPAIRGLEGSLVYLVERFGAQGTIYDVDFRPPPQPARTNDCGLKSIDHVAQVMPRGQLDGALLFYRSVFGFEAEPAFELIDPYGLIQSRVVENADRTVRIPLNASLSPNTTSARFVATYSGAGVHHIAITTDDIFATIRAMRANDVPLLEIPANYYENLAALYDLPADRLEEMRRLSILYDRTNAGEFFHAYTLAFDGRFFFEFVERRNYDGFGAANASVRLAAQAVHDTSQRTARVSGQAAI
ncbi:MAG TPA: TIM barrel protein [Xanthobacteraceae bacterium]|nr:TIM barrel protein [Xanthobacteraceae bacterium]